MFVIAWSLLIKFEFFCKTVSVKRVLMTLFTLNLDSSWLQTVTVAVMFDSFVLFSSN